MLLPYHEADFLWKLHEIGETVVEDVAMMPRSIETAPAEAVIRVLVRLLVFPENSDGFFGYLSIYTGFLVPIICALLRCSCGTGLPCVP